MTLQRCDENNSLTSKINLDIKKELRITCTCVPYIINRRKKNKTVKNDLDYKTTDLRFKFIYKIKNIFVKTTTPKIPIKIQTSKTHDLKQQLPKITHQIK